MLPLARGVRRVRQRYLRESRQTFQMQNSLLGRGHASLTSAGCTRSVHRSSRATGKSQTGNELSSQHSTDSRSQVLCRRRHQHCYPASRLHKPFSVYDRNANPIRMLQHAMFMTDLLPEHCARPPLRELLLAPQRRHHQQNGPTLCLSPRVNWYATHQLLCHRTRNPSPYLLQLASENEVVALA